MQMPFQNIITKHAYPPAREIIVPKHFELEAFLDYVFHFVTRTVFQGGLLWSFFRTFLIELVSFVVAIIARCADYEWTILTANSTSKYFRKLQFLCYHSYSRKNFQLLLSAVN